MKTIFSAKWTLLKMLSAGLMAVALIPSAAQADDYFLQFTGPNIDGESKDKAHPKWIDIDSFSWGASNSGSVSPGGGGGSGKASFQDFEWSQGLDKSFPSLSSNLAKGTHIDKAVVELWSTGENRYKYLEMTFEEVLLTSVNISAADGVRPDVQGSFSYGKIDFKYFMQDNKGKPKADGEFKFNLGENALAAGAALPESAALVPEPETYAMLMAGLGLLGVIARRRQRVGAA